MIQALQKLNNKPNRRRVRQLAKSKPAKAAIAAGQDALARLTPCAMKYAKAVADPFSSEALGACIPTPGPPSATLNSLQTITAFIGTNGYGFVALSPCACRDTPSFWYTTPAFTDTSANIYETLAPNNLRTGVDEGYSSHLPLAKDVYGFDGFAEGSNAARVVSMGARITYTGTQLNMGGTFYCASPFSHQSVNAYGPGNVAALASYNVDGITRKPCELTVYATTSDENDYAQGADVKALYPFCRGETTWIDGTGGPFHVTKAMVGSGNIDIPPPIGIIMFTGEPGSSFLVEVITHTEVTGPLYRNFTKAKDVDIYGLSLVSTAVANATKEKRNKRHPNFWSAFKTAFKEVAVAAAPIALSMGKAAAMAMII